MWSTTFDLGLPTFLSLLGTFHFLLPIFLVKKKNHVGGWKTEIKSKKKKKKGKEPRLWSEAKEQWEKVKKENN